MKLCKRIVPVLLVIFMLSTTAFAAGSINLSQDMKLTISYQDDAMPLAGAEFSIYLVASADGNGELTTEDTFKQFNVNIRGKNDAALKVLATTLEGYVLRDKIAPTDSGKTNTNGYLSFPTGTERLTPGLYLVLGSRHTQGGFRYDATPFMVMLPTQDAEKNEWIYDVLVSPKHDSSKIPDTPSAITRKVLKVWDDADNKNRPTEVIVQLLRNGEVYDTVTLNDDNNWRYTLSNLDDSYTWTVVEKECEGYTVQIERDGITFVIKNTYETNIPDNPTTNVPVSPNPTNPTPNNPSLPKTGQTWWPVPLLLMGGLSFIIVGLICRKRKGN